MVVDDEPEVLKLVEEILAEDGFKVVTAAGADIALRSFETMPHRPDLVLTDVVMPGMSGPMLVDRLLTIHPGLRVLFMSGYDDRQVVHRYVVEKGFRLITKPFSTKSLRGAVHEAISAGPTVQESKT
jgi:DNA-binding NtrC family response regulator